MAAGYWLKLYTEILENPEYYRLSDNAKLGIYELLIVAKKVDQDGKLPTLEDLAFYTRRDEAWWTPVIQELQKIKFLIMDDSGSLVIRNFSTRQAPVDDAERKRQERAKKHRMEFEDTPSHAPVTELSRFVMESRDREETEAEAEKSREDADVPPAGGDNGSGPIDPLLTTFHELTMLPLPTDVQDKQRWDLSISQMHTAGVTSEILSQAIGELQSKRYKIAGPWSAVKPAIICLDNRREAERRRDSDGIYSDLINR